MSKTQFGLKQLENMHGHRFICLGQQEHAFQGSALHFIQITWFTHVFANIRKVSKCVHIAGCDGLKMALHVNDGHR